MKFTLTLLSLALFFQNSLLAQYSVSGHVFDAKESALFYANVSLLNAADSAWIQTVSSDDAGAFAMKDVASGVYLLDVRLLGYATQKKLLTITGNTSDVNITLQGSGAQMEEIVVAAKKNIIETGLGKTIVHVRDNVKLSSNLLDVLKIMPGVNVRPDGTISMDGKEGVMVLIDGKRTYMTGRELAEYLKSINASEVANVELMTQPSAKYDAEGNSGIINIKMNKNKREGWKGVATGMYSQAQYPFVSANSNISYRKNNITYKLQPGYYRGTGYLKSITETTALSEGLPQNHIREESFRKESFPDYSLSTGVDYDVTEKTNVALTARGIYHTNKEVDKTTSAIENYVIGDKILNLTENRNGHQRGNADVMLFAQHEIDSTQNLQLDAGYFYKQRDIYQKLNSTNYDEQGIVLAEPLILDNKIPDVNHLYTAQLDYTGKPGKKVDLECGVKASHAAVDEKNLFHIYKNNTWQRDTTRTNEFLYDETITAAYASVSGKAGKFQLKGGVRVEHTHIEGNQATQDIQFSKDYTSVFPTAYVTCKASDKHTVELNYNRRLQRPYYRELNPFIWVTSQYSIREGNPMMNPQFSNNLELKHNYRGRLLTSLSCSQTSGVFTDRLRYNKQTNVSYYSTGNNGRRFKGALSAYYNNQLYDWLNVNAGGIVNYTEYEADYNGEHHYASNMWYYASVDTQLSFKKGWNANFHTRYVGPYYMTVVQRVGGSMWVNADVSKNLFEDTLSVKLSVQDPFHTYRYIENMYLPDVVVASSSEFATQSLALGLTYNFGKRDELRRRERTIEGSERL